MNAPRRELDSQLQERCKEERARLGRELHDTLLQGFLGASMLLHEVVRQTPADSPSKVLLCRALYLVERAIEEGRATLQGLCRVEAGSTSLEQALSAIQDQFMPATGTQTYLDLQNRSACYRGEAGDLDTSGRIKESDVDMLRALLEQETSAVAIDLKQVLLADREAIRFFGACELNGIEIRNCLPYIREWISRESADTNAADKKHKREDIEDA